jgi:hypothetical protein
MYQFIHIETYARSTSTKVKPTKSKFPKADTPQERLAALGGANAPRGMDAFVNGQATKKPKATSADVLAEALRDEGHCAHVEAPLPPVFLLGDEAALRALPLEIERNCEAEKARTGRAPRKDMHVLLAGVASYPRELAEQDQASYEKWEKATTKWLQKKYGKDLRVVLRHEDEAHPHIHFFVCSSERVNAKELHEGHVASAHLKGKDALSKEATQLYNDAMRDFQSAFYAEVGHTAGLLRDGPKRKRMDRSTYKALQREARERVALDKQSELARSELLNTASIEAQKAAEIRREHERQMAIERAELNQLRDQNQRERAALDSDWARVREAKTITEKTLADATQLKKNVDQEYATLMRTRETVEQVKGEVQAQQRTLLREISETQKTRDGLQSAEVLRLKTEVERLEAEKAKAPKLDYQSKGVLALMEAEPKWKELILEATGNDSVRMALIAISNDTEMAQDAQKPTDHTKGLDQQTPDKSVYQSNDSYGL